MKPNCHALSGLVCLVLALGCASTDGAWQEARRQDTPGAYHRFLRDNPDAPQAPEARERMAFTRLQKDPTPEGYAEFRAAFPQSPLLAEIQPIIEARAFAQARGRGTAGAYRAFLGQFPDGPNAARAAGNAEYLEARGFVGRPADLAAFAARHPASDFATEAGRSGASADARRRSAIRRVGLVIEIAPGTPGADRVARALAEFAARQYAQTPLQIVPLAGRGDPNAARVDALLTIRHREEEVKAEIGFGHTTTPGVLATTSVTLVRTDDSAPVWSDEFHHKASLSERREDQSLLFGATGRRYWEALHLPVVSWSTQLAVRAPYAFPKPAVAVEAIDHRAVVLFESGDFQIVDLSDPASPQVLSHYRRPNDMTKWSDLRVIDGRVVIFGGDGLEIVELASEAPRRLRALDRTKVGSVVAVEKSAAGLLVAGNRGVMLVKGGVAEPQLLIERNVVAAAMRADRLLFTDGESLFVASVQALLSQRAEAELRFRQDFVPERIRVEGANAVVLGERGVLLVDVSDPRVPRLRSRVSTLAVGAVHDAMVVRGRLVLLGERGLQISDPSGTRFDDSADVAARARMSAAGRHLVMIGEAALQVVDTTPFVAPPNLAAPRP